MSQPAITSTTQDFLDIYDITNDMVFMKDGSAAAILLVSAMNFSLLAEEEQDAVIYAYAALLNSLNFQVQINIQSKTKDATTYLELLKTREDEATSADKKRRIGRYREFVSELIQERNVLDKKFYVVIPTSPLEMGIVPPQSLIPGKSAIDISTIEKNTLLEKAAGLLGPRVEHLIGQFNRIGLYARQFATQEIIQNYYNNYNPEAVEGQQITDTGDYTTPLVQASIFESSVKNRQQIIQQFSHKLAEADSESVGQVAPELVPELPTQVESDQPLEEAVVEAGPEPAPAPEPQMSPVAEAPTSGVDQLAEVVAASAPEPVNVTTDQQIQSQPSLAQPAVSPQPLPQTYSLPPVAEIK